MELDREHKKQVEKEVHDQMESAEKEIEEKIEKRFHERLIGGVHKRSKHLSSKFREHASTAIIAAFSFLIALAWKDLIVKFVNEKIKVSSVEKYPYIAELSSALIITVFAIIGIMFVARWVKKEEKKD